MPTVAAAFSKRPKKWGLRGDLFLWDALGWIASESIAHSTEALHSPAKIKLTLNDAFESLLANGQLHGEGAMAIDWLPNDGMSGGLIHMPTWRKFLMPEIISRLEETAGASSNHLEYHPAEHRFRFAAWAAATAARSSRSVCTFPVSVGASLLRESELRWVALGNHWLPRSRKAFDSAHDTWCQGITSHGQRVISSSFTYGIAAKLVNCYLKALFLQTMVGSPFDPDDDRLDRDHDVSTRLLHPPIDRILMAEAARRSDSDMKPRWRKLLSTGWSQFTREDYIEAVGLIYATVGEDLAQIEACWIGHQ